MTGPCPRRCASATQILFNLLTNACVHTPPGTHVHVRVGTLRRLRAAGNDCPILFLTARTGTDDRISGLSVGGDDYVSKPFSIEEVLLRIEAILRRTAPAVTPQALPSVLSYADLELDEGAHEVHRAGEYIALSPTEFKLLAPTSWRTPGRW
jgi:DNA-binding response OmpR family regulator